MPNATGRPTRRTARRAHTALLPLLALALQAAGAQGHRRAEPPSFDVLVDVLIVNGRVLDGAGNPDVAADVGVRGDRSAAVGSLGGFDLARPRDRTTYLRPRQFSEGVEYVLVNGRFPLDGGGLTTAPPGVVITRPAGTAPPRRTVTAAGLTGGAR